ncbi:hypothetical protein D3C86_1823480 [compost metagenome]
MTINPLKLMRTLFTTAISASHPYHVLPKYLPKDRSGRLIVIGAGRQQQLWPKSSSLNARRG